MISFPQKLLLGAAVALTSLTKLAHSADCTVGPFGGFQAVGEDNPGTAKDGKDQAFCASLHDIGVPITGLDVWSDGENGVRGIKVYYANNDVSDIYGTTSGFEPAQPRWDYSNGDLFTDLAVWGNGKHQQVGGMRLQINHKDFNIEGRHSDEFPIKVSSGILIGIRGYANADNINQLTFLFLKDKIDKIQMTDIVYKDSPENLNADQAGIEKGGSTLDHQEFENNTPSNETIVFSNSQMKADASTFSSLITNTFGAKVSVEIEQNILALSAKEGLELSYGYEDARGRSDTTTNTHTLMWSSSSVLQPGHKLFCRAQSGHGENTLEYSAKINVLLTNGEAWSWTEDGKHKLTSWTQGQATCQEKPFTDTDPKTNSKRAIPFIA